MTPDATFGKKHNAQLRTTEIAALVRKDIQAAIREGKLPAGLKTNVRTKYFSGGSSIDIRVTIVPGDFQVLNPARLKWERDNPFKTPEGDARDELTPNAKELLKTLEDIMRDYNRDNSDTATDYFDVRFYQHAHYDYEIEAIERARVSA